MDSKELLGAVAVLLTVLAYIPYFRSLVTRRTKPHLFSWIIWAVLAGILCVAQYVKGAGAGCWMLGFTALMCAIISVFAIFRGEKRITTTDWIAFIGGFLAIVPWYLTHDPLWTVVIACIIDLIACYPTLRKSYAKPWEESGLSYGLQCVRAVFAWAALENYSLVTVLPPIALIISNGLLTSMLLWRRTVISK